MEKERPVVFRLCYFRMVLPLILKYWLVSPTLKKVAVKKLLGKIFNLAMPAA